MDHAGRAAPPPEALDFVARPGHVIAWLVGDGAPPFPMRFVTSRAERIRHYRKYAEGTIRYHSFYFQKPDGRHDLRAQNLAMFCQIAEGIDEETWLFHLCRGDYSRWFRDVIKDVYVADQIARIERRIDLGSWESRRIACALIRARYTLPE